MNPAELLKTCEEAARTAGNHALANRHRAKDIATQTPHDLKLVLDLECQAKAEEIIRAKYPDHAILGEEGGAFPKGDEPLWIIDPIDGTLNFFHDMPIWCSSVAVRIGTDMIAGCVFVPVIDECYTAHAEGPALRNGKPIHATSVPTLSEAMVLTGFSKDSKVYGGTLGLMQELAFKARKVRLMGAAAVDICHVASGRADAYIEYSIFLWDIAAASLIAQRAGARVEVLEELGPTNMRFLCTNGVIHEELKGLALEILNKGKG